MNLDYEWSVIQGRRPYRWTIWVCNDMRYYLVSLLNRILGLICTFC